MPKASEKSRVRPVQIFLGLTLFISTPVPAQITRHWDVQGDTSGAPAGCSARAGFDAIDAWFVAMARHDSAGLTRVMSSRFVFSIGRFTPHDAFFVERSIGQLVDYARRRASHRERLVLQAITFNRWRGQGLEFGPVYFLRTADDLGPKSRPALEKESICATVACPCSILLLDQLEMMVEAQCGHPADGADIESTASTARDRTVYRTLQSDKHFSDAAYSILLTTEKLDADI